MTATVTRWSMPDATVILPSDAPRPQWLAKRRRGLGGSDASTVVGVNRWSSRYELWLDKTGRLPEREQSPRMEAGIRMEPVMRQWFTDQTGIAVRRQGLVQSRTRPWQMVSLDGLTIDGGIFESKCTNWRLADEWDDGQVADHAEVQAQHGLAVTGRTHAWVVALIDGWDFQIRRVERDEKLIEIITSAEDEFWHGHVIADREPAIEPMALDVIKERFRDIELATIAGSPVEMEPVIDEWTTAKAVEKAAEANRKRVEGVLRAALGPAEAMTLLGEPALTCKANGTFASSRFIADHPDLAEELTVDKPALDMDRLKQEHPDLYQTYRARVLRAVTAKKAN